MSNAPKKNKFLVLFIVIVGTIIAGAVGGAAQAALYNLTKPAGSADLDIFAFSAGCVISLLVALCIFMGQAKIIEKLMD